MGSNARHLVPLIRKIVGSPSCGVEVGVFKGDTSVDLLCEFPDCRMTFIDPWREWGEGDSYRSHRRTGSLTQQQWDKIKKSAFTRIQTTSQSLNWRIMAQTSEVACDVLKGELFDFVFLDGDHTYERVKADITSWIERVRVGGLLCGHDYGGKYRGVKRAVNELFDVHQIHLPGGRIWGYQKGE